MLCAMTSTTDSATDSATADTGASEDTSGRGWIGPFHTVSLFLALGSATTAAMLWRAMGTMSTELVARDIEPDVFVFLCDDWPLPALLVLHAVAFLLKDFWVKEFLTNLLWNASLWLGASLPIAIALTLSQRQLAEAIMADAMR